ncbi:MAG TPA: TetR/AcrR family transcriptional regulator [Candidatus Limnocylindrales bacterium]|nr:TetR/AcrR family transcriptional regulator [Candidatus Limnocylindrales bacterium]
MKTLLNRPAENTRRRILEAAFDEFYTKGFQGGSLNNIVEKARTTKGALFHHFEGKTYLGYAVVEEIVQARIKEQWLDPLANSIDPIEDLKRTLRDFVKSGSQSGRITRGCPLNNLAQEMSPLDEGLRQRIEKVYVTWREGLAAAFIRGINTGTVRANISPRKVAAFVVAAQAGIIGTGKAAQSKELMAEAGAGLFDYLDSLKP